MTLRNTSGKFNIPGFGRKNSEGPTSPARASGSESPSGHGREPSGSFAGLGNKLGKTIAHQSIIPSLGNQENRLLQEWVGPLPPPLPRAGADGQQLTAAVSSRRRRVS